MSTLYGVNNTLITQNNPKEKIPHGEHGGRVRVLYDKYVPAGAIAINSTVDMGGPIPKGARVIEAIAKFSDLGTVGSFKFGYKVSADGVEVADDDSFMGQVDCHTAADVILASQQQAAPAGIFKQFLAEVQPQLLFDAATDAAGTIETVILYVFD